MSTQSQPSTNSLIHLCPVCGQKFRTESNAEADLVKCPHCHQLVRLNNAEKGSDQPPRVNSADHYSLNASSQSIGNASSKKPSAPFSISLNPAILAQSSNKTGFQDANCICCGTLLRFPLNSPKARCAVCSTISPAPGSVCDVDHAYFSSQTKEHLSFSKCISLFQTGTSPDKNVDLMHLILNAFSNPYLLNFSFLEDDLVDKTCCDITSSHVNLKDLRKFYHEIVAKLPLPFHVDLMKTIKNILLQPPPTQIHCDLRYIMILMENPLFSDFSYVDVFSHLLGITSSLSNQWHHWIVHWIVQYDASSFTRLVLTINQFIAHRLFGQRDVVPSIPEPHRDWWISCATKVLALFNAANKIKIPPIISYELFYNESLDHIDFVRDYDIWQSGFQGFAFCQYSFILSMQAKMAILEIDAQRQMAAKAQDALVSTLLRGVPTDPYFTVEVRRDHLIEDSVRQILNRPHDLKKKLRIKFHGEPGVDVGGLTKEWFLLLIREIFNENFGMFSEDEDSHYMWFTFSSLDNELEYKLIGVLMGLAIYNGQILDLHFPPACYKKLLNLSISLHDLKQCMPAAGKGYQQLLDFDGDVESVFCRNFEISFTAFGETINHPLIEGGEKIPLTNLNRSDYVARSVDWLMNVSIKKQFEAFSNGFFSVAGGNALSLLRPEELESLICGSTDINFSELEQVTQYEGFQKTDPTVVHFWAILDSWDEDMKKKFLLFCTGTDRVPFGGMKEMKFKISKVIAGPDKLPFAHTCFNQLCIVDYKSKDLLEKKLKTAILWSEGFGIK